jgi:hypothetical protein
MSKSLDTIPAEVIFALTSALAGEAKARRKELEAGTKVDLDTEVTLHVTGPFSVGDDEKYTPTVDIPTKLAFALFIEYSGVTGPHAMAALTKAMNKAAEIGKLQGKARKTKEAEILALKSLADAEKTVRSGLDALDEKTRNGKVHTKGIAVTVAGEVEEPEAAAK